MFFLQGSVDTPWGGEKETYASYLEGMISEYVSSAKDWSLFEPAPPIFDGGAGTQQLLKMLGSNTGLN